MKRVCACRGGMWESGGVTPCILHLGTQLYAPPLYPMVKIRWYHWIRGRMDGQIMQHDDTWNSSRLERGEVLKEATTELIVFWDVTPCCLVEMYRHFGITYFLHLRVIKVGLNMEEVRYTETSLNLYQTTWRHSPKRGNFHSKQP
jgi:hypothetical protein